MPRREGGGQSGMLEVCELGSKLEFKGRNTYSLLGKGQRTALAMAKTKI